MLSVHVDDIKMCGEESVMKDIVDKLEAQFDSVKLERDNFLHLGLQHDRLPDGSVTISQQHYITELRPIPEDKLKFSDKAAVLAFNVPPFRTS